MDSNLSRYFSRIGGRVRVLRGVLAAPQLGAPHTRQELPRIVLDICRDDQGEYFEIRTAPGTQEIVVQNVQPQEKHLLLLSRQFGEPGHVLAKQKFLCGRDEKHWFIAAIPEKEPVSTVDAAKMALKPEEIRAREEALGVSRKEGFRRRNAAFLRQGEWFFIPAGNIETDPLRLLRHEPLTRGNGGKPHWAEECYRVGGKAVYVSAQHPTGLTAAQYFHLPERQRKSGGFRMMKRDATVYVRGAITHRDHKTVVLRGWHRVLMNTENRSIARRFLAFLD